MKLQKIIIVLLLVLGIIGCSPGTPPPLTEITATQTECPPPTPVVIYKQPRGSFLIFVLIENTHPYHKSGNFKKTQENLQTFFQNNAVSGDKIVFALLSDELVENGLNASVFFDDTVEVIATQIPPTPMITPTDLPQPTPIATRRTQLGATAVALTQAVNDHNFQMTQTAVSNSYYCDYTKVQTEYVVAVSTLDANQMTRNQDFANKVASTFSSLSVEPEKETDSMEGLRMAGNYIQDNCTDPFEHCVLLIFSNLPDFREEWQSPSIDTKIKLEGVDVIPVLYDCKYNDGKCKKKVTDWTGHFNYFGAKSVMFLLNNSDIVEQLNLSFIQLTDGSK